MNQPEESKIRIETLQQEVLVLKQQVKGIWHVLDTFASMLDEKFNLGEDNK